MRVVRVIAGSQHSVLITEKGDMLTFGWQKAIGHGSGEACRGHSRGHGYGHGQTRVHEDLRC